LLVLLREGFCAETAFFSLSICAIFCNPALGLVTSPSAGLQKIAQIDREKNAVSVQKPSRSNTSNAFRRGLLFLRAYQEFWFASSCSRIDNNIPSWGDVRGFQQHGSVRKLFLLYYYEYLLQ
jgi:hypothetical protein